MIANNKRVLYKKSSLTFLSTLILSSFLTINLSAQYNMQDDLALVDGMLRVKSKGFNLDKELEIHMRLLQDRYPANILTIQKAKIEYSKDQKTKARNLFAKVPKNDPNFREMVFTYFMYATERGDSTGQKESSILYFESTLKTKLPLPGTERRNLLMDMVDIYGRLTRKDEADKKKVRFKALEAWAKKNNIEIPIIPPTQEMEEANNAAEKIVMKDPGVDPEAKVDVKRLEKLIKDQIEAEWGELDYWFFKGVVERARAQVLLGKYDDGLKTISKFGPKIMKMDEVVFKAIDDDKVVPKKDKLKVKMASSLLSGVRYVKGLANFLKARKFKNQSKLKEAEELLRGRTGAAAQFGLCIIKNKGSAEAFRAILRYDKCRDLSAKWFEKLKPLRALDQKPFYVKNIDLGKAYYNLQMFGKAISYFDKYKTAEANEESYDAVYYSLWSNFEAENYDKIEGYLQLLEGKFFHMNKKPKDYFTQTCLRLSGKYRTMKNEEEDATKKKEYEDKQLAYFKRSQSKGGGTASVAYSLAYGDLKACFDAKRKRDVKVAKEKYAEAVKAFENITKNFPTSSEAVNAYKQLGLLHEYFKNLDTAKAMYAEYLKRIATPDVKGKVDKLDVMCSLANVKFIAEDYKGTVESLDEINVYLKKESFKTKDENLEKRLKVLSEKRETLKIFSEDNLTIPKKKEARAVKADLKLNPEDEALKAKAETLGKEITADLKTTASSFKTWLSKFPESENRPSVMARLGSLHQELNEQDQARKVYEELKKKYPEHEVVKMISINIVNAHLKNEDHESAAAALKETNLSELGDDSLRYLINQFYLEEAPRGMGPQTLKTCSVEVVKLIDLLRPKYVEAKKTINELHWLDYRRARALFHQGKIADSKSILDTMVKEKPLGPYIFEVKFLLGAIASKQKDYGTVAKIYASLISLNSRMEPNPNRTVRINVEWASAYEESTEPDLIKKGRGLSMFSKETNTENLDKIGIVQVQKAGYLYILYSKKMKVEGDKINELKNAFLQKFPSSKYAFKVRKL